MFQIKGFLNKLGEQKEKGQTLIEYALLIVLIAVVVIAVLILLGPQVAAVFENIRTQLGGVAGS